MTTKIDWSKLTPEEWNRRKPEMTDARFDEMKRLGFTVYRCLDCGYRTVGALIYHSLEHPTHRVINEEHIIDETKSANYDITNDPRD